MIAQAGVAVIRRQQHEKHLAPHHVPLLSLHWSTLCGLTANSGPWRRVEDDDDAWCGGCLAQAGITHHIGHMGEEEL